MKQATLLQIIREEIYSALKEVDLDKTSGAVVMKKETNPTDIKKVTAKGIDVELKEDNLDEMAMAYSLKDGKEEELQKAIDAITTPTTKKFLAHLKDVKKIDKIADAAKALGVGDSASINNPKFREKMQQLKDEGVIDIINSKDTKPVAEPKAPRTPGEPKAPGAPKLGRPASGTIKATMAANTGGGDEFDKDADEFFKGAGDEGEEIEVPKPTKGGISFKVMSGKGDPNKKIIVVTKPGNKKEFRDVPPGIDAEKYLEKIKKLMLK